MRIRRPRSIRTELVVEAVTQEAAAREPTTDSQWIYEGRRPDGPTSAATEPGPEESAPPVEPGSGRSVLVSAERAARDIINEARQRAAAILGEAEEQARAITDRAESAAEKTTALARAEQAGVTAELARLEENRSRLLRLLREALAAIDGAASTLCEASGEEAITRG